jgi:hypothetical protein
VTSGSAYVLNVRRDRREKLLAAEGGRFGGVLAAEPVPLFNHSRRAPLVVLASFQDGLSPTQETPAKGPQQAPTWSG